MSRIAITCLLVGAALLPGCGGKSAPGDAGGAPGASASARALSFKPQVMREPCAWLTKEEVGKVVGPLAGEPYRARNAETPRPDDSGLACAYPLPGRNGATVPMSVQVDPTGTTAMEQATGMLGQMFSNELNDGRAAAPPKEEKRTDGWDHEGGLPGLHVWRLGHITVQIGGGAGFLLKSEQMDAIAALVRDRIPDVPISNGDSGGAAPPDDPCALLTRAEAEAVLGKLLVGPYPSGATSPLADPSGTACTYYTAGHHAFVITPTRSDGKTLFGMARGGSGLIRSAAGGADKGDVLDGPWDDATEGAAGTVYFLKGDAMLEVAYKTSSTDLAGAAKLAASAVGRL